MSAAATFCATLVDEWIRSGVRHAVVAPGSRSTPMALALAAREELALHVVHDERAAAFIALGLGLDGIPAVLLCTSGTAAANFHPAVVEAGLSDVPMLVVTADRPPELLDVGAAQTIDQQRLFGGSVRWFHDPGVADLVVAHTWRSLARRALDRALTGPVHLNLPFREPLVGEPGPLPTPLAVADEALPMLPASAGSGSGAANVPAGLANSRGVILAGGRSGVTAAQVESLSARTGWPVLADPISGMRQLPGAVTTADALLRHAGFGDAHVPEVIVRIGRPAASKVLAQWATAAVRAHGAVLVQVGGPGVIDPDHTVAARVSIEELLALTEAGALGGATGTPWASRWRHADQRALAAMDALLDAATDRPTEPGVARAVARAAASPEVAAEVVVSSSMPVRDLEWYGGPAARAHANRGANGIDGVTATAIGRALAGHRTILLTGDVAFLHDSAALIALVDRPADLRIVIVDNDGGGIFSFLPQAEALPGDRFERLFGTPHGTDLVALAAAHRLPARTVTTIDELVAELGVPGPRVVHVRTDRRANVAVHAELHAAVAEQLDRRP
jgi:2-succinyl-5-enolpyruvyl-6-hydroxy-3-cyclohexene-1-carboxylate synthase